MELIKNLGNTHILLVIKPVLSFMDETDKEILKAFLDLKFPGASNEQTVKAFKNTTETEIYQDSAFKTFKELMSAYTDKLGRNEILSLEQIIDIYDLDDEEYFQELNELITLIKEKVSPQEIEEHIKENILDNLDIISNVLQTNSRKTSKNAAISALKRLSDICEKHPESMEFVSKQIASYDSHIKFIAPDFCGEKVNLPAEKLSLFEMTIRNYRISEN